MKTLTIIAAASLTANAVLGWFYWQNELGADADLSATSTGGRTISRSVGGASSASHSAGDDLLAEVVDAPLAAALKSGDPKSLLAALRGAGFPEKFIRDIMIWKLGDTTKEKRAALLTEANLRPFWKSETRTENAAWEKALNDLDAKNLPITKEIFAGAVPALPQINLDDRRFGYLPADKIERVADLNREYNMIRRESVTPGSGNNAENLAVLDREKHVDLEKILSPDELALYNLYSSPSALALRRQMTMFQPSEEEFQAMYDARSAADQRAADAAATPKTPAERVAETTALNDQYRTILGDARYAEFQRGQDQGYQAAVEITAHYNLPAENAAQVFALQQSTQQRVQQLMQDTNSDPAERRAAALAVVSETNASLTTLLGAEGTDAYLKTGGAWLRSFNNPVGNGAARITPPAGR